MRPAAAPNTERYQLYTELRHTQSCATHCCQPSKLHFCHIHTLPKRKHEQIHHPESESNVSVLQSGRLLPALRMRPPYAVWSVSPALLSTLMNWSSLFQDTSGMGCWK
jgi:hypothetical protein